MTNMQIISCIRFCIQLLITESIYTFAFERRKHFIIKAVAAICMYFSVSLLIFELLSAVPWENPVISIVYYIGIFACSLLSMAICFKDKVEEILFAGICGYATQHIAYAFITIIQQITYMKLNVYIDFIVIRILPYIVISAAAYFFIVRHYEGKSEHKQKDIRMITLALVILFIVVVNSVLVDSTMFSGDSSLLQNVFCKMYAIVCCILAVFMAFNMSRQNQIIREKEMMEQMINNIGEKQKLSKETIDIINIKCHDLKYRISKITRIEDADEQKKYVDDVRNALAIYDNIFQTGNEALDLVLTEKSILCIEYRIKLSTMVDGSMLNFMKTTDVYALFGNLMDNAIESVIKEEDDEKRIISISVKEKNKGAHIHIENYCNEQITFDDGLPVTTKEDKNYHGFGAKSIRYIVDHYHGTMLMRTDKMKFITDIIFFPEQ